MKKLIVRVSLALLAVAGCASQSYASSILLNNCNSVGLCNQVQVTTTLNLGAINVSVTDVAGAPTVGLFGDSGANRAFAFNVSGSTAGIAFSNFSSGFSYAGANINLGGPYGSFEFAINGPGSGSDATLPLTFTVNRTGGFSSDSDLWEANSDGYFFTAHVRLNDGAAAGLTGWAAANNGNTTTATTPEPASMVLMGTGLLAIAHQVRRRMGKK